MGGASREGGCCVRGQMSRGDKTQLWLERLGRLCPEKLLCPLSLLHRRGDGGGGRCYALAICCDGGVQQFALKALGV